MLEFQNLALIIKIKGSKMELRESLENLELKILDLMIQPYFKYYLNTLINKVDLKENIDIVLDEIRSTLKENDLYILNHYELLVENYYSLLNFYEEQLEESSKFASQEILKMMSLNPDLENSYAIFFKVDFYSDSIPLDIKFVESNVNDKNMELLNPLIENENLSLLINSFNNLKVIKNNFKEKILNFELENLFFILSYQIDKIKKNTDDNFAQKLNQIVTTINAIKVIFLNLGLINNDEELLTIPSKVINSEGLFEIEIELLENKKLIKKINLPNLDNKDSKD